MIKTTALTIAIIAFVIAMIGLIQHTALEGDLAFHKKWESHGKPQEYDPNNPAYLFIPEADPSWIKRFGASERTRLLHSISELRVVVANQAKRIIAFEQDPFKILSDPNGYTVPRDIAILGPVEDDATSYTPSWIVEAGTVIKMEPKPIQGRRFDPNLP